MRSQDYKDLPPTFYLEKYCKMLLFLLLALVISGWAGENPCDNICFHETENACPEYNASEKCKISPTCPNAVICCHLSQNISDILKSFRTQLNKSTIEKLHIRNATTTSFELHWLNVWRVSSLAITDGHIDRISGHFPRSVKSPCLNFSANGIKKFHNESLKHVQTMKILDLSHNNFTHVPPFQLGTNITLDISDNKVLECDNLIDILKRYDVSFNNVNDTTCLSRNIFSWFNSTELIYLTHVERLHELRRNCTLKNCSCEAHRLVFNQGQETTFAMKVDCAGRQLTSLPTPLPANTVALNVSNNNITSLEPIGDDSYVHLRELYADNNKISSILPLMDSPTFISSFTILSLRSNAFKTIPTYILSNIFDRNDNFRQLNLGQNRLECDCNTAKSLKVWLLNKEKYIKDYREVFCDNMELRVTELDVNKLCKTQQDWTDYIYYIITAEILLLLLLIGKVSYDYWVFKTAGYLPWPASKMPKLPCDWLCE